MEIEVYKANERWTTFVEDTRNKYAALRDVPADWIVAKTVEELADDVAFWVHKERVRVLEQIRAEVNAAEGREAKRDELEYADLSRIIYDGSKGTLIKHLEESKNRPSGFLLLHLSHMDQQDIEEFDKVLYETLQSRWNLPS